jgi:hypothetical protein
MLLQNTGTHHPDKTVLHPIQCYSFVFENTIFGAKEKMKMAKIMWSFIPQTL